MVGVAIRVLLGGCVAFVVAVCTGGTAAASPTKGPQAGDPRALAVSGNAVTCAQAGLSGSIVPTTAVVSPDNRYVTITSVPDGMPLTGTVVKGGPAFNIYPGQALTLLHAPSLPSGHRIEVSYYFSCAIRAPEQPSFVVPSATCGGQPAGTDSRKDPADEESTDGQRADTGDECDAEGASRSEGGTAAENDGTGGDSELAYTAPEFPIGPAIVLGLVLLALGSLFLAPGRRCSRPKERPRD